MNVFDQPWTETAPAHTIQTLALWSSLPAETMAQWPRQIPAANFPVETLLDAHKPVVIADLANSGALDAGYFAALAARSAIFVPLQAGGQWLGYLGALYPQPRTFSEAELQRLAVLAGQAAVAINSRQLFDNLQARARRERLLREITTRVRTSMDADTILRTAVRELGTALDREAFIRLGVTSTPAMADTPTLPAASLQEA
jgi:GAF domain-containing protein